MLQQILEEIFYDIDWTHSTIILSIVSVAFMPIFWTIFGRIEYHTRKLTKLLGNGNRYRAVYIFAAIIWILSAFRDNFFRIAMESQPSSELMLTTPFLPQMLDVVGYTFVAVGQLFVLTSMWRLGITGTYYGDHFGILKNERITAFPFNLLDNPMYVGSTMTFGGSAFLWKSWIGVVVTLWVIVCYRVALYVEEPFTAMIYEEAATNERKPFFYEKIVNNANTANEKIRNGLFAKSIKKAYRKIIHSTVKRD